MLKYLSAISYGLQSAILGLMVFFVLVFSWGGTFQGRIFEKFCVFFVLLLAGLGMWLLNGAFKKELSVRVSPVHTFVGVFVACVLASAVFSVAPHRSIWGPMNDPFLGIIGTTAVAVLFVWVANMPFRYALSGGMLGYALGATVLALSVLAQVFGMSLNVPFLDESHSIGTLQIILFVNIPVLIWLLSWREMKGYAWWRVFQRSIAAFLFAALFVTLGALGAVFGNVVWAPILVGIGVPCLFLLARKVRVSHKALFALAGVVLICGMLPIISLLFGDRRNALLETHGVGAEDARLAWDVTENSVRSRPLMGYGPGLYAYAYSKEYPAYVNETPMYGVIFPVARGVIYEYAATIGLVGSVAFLLIIATYMGLVWFFLHKHEALPWSTVILFGVAMSVASALFFWELNGVMLFLFFFFVGMTFASSQRDEFSDFARSREVILRVRAQYSVSALLLLAGIFVGVGLAGDMLRSMFIAGVYAERAGNSKLDESDLLEAVRLDESEPEYQRQLAEVYAAKALQTSASSPDDAANLEVQWNAAFSAGSKAKSSDPHNVRIIATLAGVYENAGSVIPDAYALALEEYRVAEDLAPNDPLFFFKEGIVLLHQAHEADDSGKEKFLLDAVTALKHTVELAPTFSAAQFQLALAYSELGDNGSAERYMKQAIVLAPENQDYLATLAKLYLDTDQKNGEAKALLDKSLGLGEGHVVTNLYLGRWYAQAGMKDQAREAYERAKRNLGEEQKGAEQYIDSLIADVDKKQEPVVPPHDDESAAAPEEEGTGAPSDANAETEKPIGDTESQDAASKTSNTEDGSNEGVDK